MAVKRTGKQVGRPARVPIGPNEVQARQAKIADLEEYLDSVKTGKKIDKLLEGDKENVNIETLEKQLEREKQALEYLGPKEGNASEKRKAQIDFNEAKDYIEKNALSQREISLYPKPGDYEKDIDYGKAVEKSMAQEVGNPKFTEMANQLKRAASILDPENPELRNINKYRKES